MLMRYRVDLSYLGRDFHGWQKQPNAVTVQQTIEDAFSIVFKDNIEFMGCGRTDTGVHAREFTAHFDSKREYTEANVRKLNNYLPFSISIKSIVKTKDDFHARFDAISRTYEYNISVYKNPFIKEFSWFIPIQLDVELMNKCAKILYEYKDFTSFSKLHTDVKTNNCDVKYAHFTLQDDLLVFEITADRFLRNMVRAIVGTLVDVGKGKISQDEFVKVIEAKDRSKAGQSAPAEGLFLTKISYPNQ